jgi:cell fate (sporulation/competence/biofilm development) regulator YmcA (YheA/YmcA/DUF963 family)
MDKELQNYLDQFIENFLNVKEVKQYLFLKEEITHSEELITLENEVKKAQKEMALSINKPEYQEKKNQYFALKEKYDQHPLIVNYYVEQKEVMYLLDELQASLARK